MLSEARKFRCANPDTPCHFFFVDLHSVAKVGITSPEVYDLVLADNVGQSTFVLLFTDRDDRRPRSTGSDDAEAAEALATRRKAKRPAVYPCCGCHRPFSPPTSDAKVAPAAQVLTDRVFGVAEAREEPRHATRRFEVSLHQLDVKKRKKPKNENENEDRDNVGGRDEDKKLLDDDAAKKMKKRKQKEKKVSMKHLMGSALAYFLARLSAYQPARAAGSSTPPDALWVVGKRGGRSGAMCDLAAQVAEFVAIQRELACDRGASQDMLASHFLGLVDDRHADGGNEEDIDEGWAGLRSAGVLGVSDQKKSEAANTTQPDVLKNEGDAAQSGQTAPAVSASIVKIVKRVEKWILKNARNDFKRHKAALADVDNYRDVVMLPRDRVKLRNFIAPLCRLVRKIDADEVLALLQADGVLGVCGCCRQFKWNERALTSDDCRLERRRRLERERARGIAQGRERMVERILGSLEAKGSRPTNMAELRKVVDNFGDYEEHFDGDQVLQHLINANIIAVDAYDDDDVGVDRRRRENVRYVVAQRRIEGMKHQERLDRARRQGDQAAWQAELDREKQRREAARQEQQALQQANRERDEAERARLREIHARERDEAEQRDKDERQRQQERDERKKRHISATSQQKYSVEPASSSSWSSSSAAGAPSLKQSADQLTAVDALFASPDDDYHDGEEEVRWANTAPSHGWDQHEGGAGSGWAAEEEAVDWMASAGALFDGDSTDGGDDDEDDAGSGRGDYNSEPRQQWETDSRGVNNNDDGPSLAEMFGGGSGVPRGLDMFGGWTTTATTTTHHHVPAEEEDGDGGGVVDLSDGLLDMFGDDRWYVPVTQQYHGHQAKKNEDEDESEGDDEHESGVGLLFDRGEEEEEEEEESTMAGLHYLGGGHSFVSTEWNPGF